MKLKRIAPGNYEAANGHRIVRDEYGWMILTPKQQLIFSGGTLKECRDYIKDNALAMALRTTLKAGDILCITHTDGSETLADVLEVGCLSVRAYIVTEGFVDFTGRLDYNMYKSCQFDNGIVWLTPKHS